VSREHRSSEALLDVAVAEHARIGTGCEHTARYLKRVLDRNRRVVAEDRARRRRLAGAADGRTANARAEKPAV
jgi:hypothetical protein